MQLLCTGLPVCQGIVHGRIHKLTENTQEITSQDILVLESSNPSYALEVMKAGGIVLERGGKLAHLCIVALEMGIPCITQVEGAMSLLNEGQQVILDAFEGGIYERRG